MCEYINPIDTHTKFIILMHPKEFQKTKNGTGRFTHLNLSNSEIFVGIDFSKHQYINNLINDKTNNCYVLYPHKNSINLNTQNIKQKNKNNIIFIIDSTWPCSKKILAVSSNINSLPKISFSHTKASNFKIKTQPNEYCLSTIESTLCVLELLNTHNCEDIKKEQFEKFLLPFEKMVEYQINCVVQTKGNSARYKKPSYKQSNK
jgi:DTW domain-containing protein YfiP